ncbi:DedA family protein [Polymorphospora lycopeni]|uniref:VTT domain-containing protein n=1 Tax=Polymorphospora lycopeni TaxID=3140240 RepID=A0ABV5CLN2_9ACTN
MDPAQVLWTGVTDHPYLLLGPLVLIEGPAATVVAGALVGAGMARFWPIWLIVVVADVLADSSLYLLGRFGNHRRVAPLLGRLGLPPHRRQRLTTAVRRALPRVVLGAKVVDVAAVPAFLAAGLARAPYRRFLAWVAGASTVRAALLIGAGVLFGQEVAHLLTSPGTGLAVAAGLALAVVATHLITRRLAGTRFDPVKEKP